MPPTASTMAARPPGRRAEQVEGDAHEAVDRDLGHHAAHQRRDVARRGGMRERQPGVQRHDAGLRSGADQRQHQRQRGDARRRMHRAHRGEGVAAGRAGEQAEAQQQRQAGEARHDDVDVAGMRVAALAMVRHHQRPGGERHQFPGEQEAERIVGDHHEVQAGEEGRIERQHALRLVLVPAVAQRVEAGAGAAQPDHDQEERGERIEAEMRAGPGQAERQGDGRRLGAEREQCRPAATRTRSPGCRHRRCRGQTASCASERTGHGEAEQQQRCRRESSSDHVRRGRCVRRGAAASSDARRVRPGCWPRLRRSARCRRPAARRPASSASRRCRAPRRRLPPSAGWWAATGRTAPASARWSIPSMARAARICAAVIMPYAVLNDV